MAILNTFWQFSVALDIHFFKMNRTYPQHLITTNFLKKCTMMRKIFHEQGIYILKAGVCGHSNVPKLTSPPILKLLDSQGYLWLPYDLADVIKLFGETFEQKTFFFQIPSIFLSFLPDYCHSFFISVIPSVLLSFLPYYCHSFRIIVISNICHPE